MILDEAKPIAADEALPVEALRPWLEGLLGRPVVDLELGRFGRGYSNLTYLLKADGEELVLRRGPPGVRIDKAHDMAREARILQGVRRGGERVLVPEVLAVCEDPAVLGGPFYVMRRMRGVILRKEAPAGLDVGPGVMARASEGLVRALVDIHAIDTAAAGLGDLGRPEGYIQRQVEGWTRRYVAARTDDVPDMEALAAELDARRPPDGPSALIHNDFKYDNVILDPADLGRVIGVLDWEMSTVGDVWMDVGTMLSYWVQADDPPQLQVIRFCVTDLPGNLTREGLVDTYARLSGRAVPEVAWFYAFGLYKTAVVAQQLYARYARGLTKEERYAPMIWGVYGLAAIARQALASGRLSGW